MCMEKLEKGRTPYSEHDPVREESFEGDAHCGRRCEVSLVWWVERTRPELLPVCMRFSAFNWQTYNTAHGQLSNKEER